MRVNDIHTKCLVCGEQANAVWHGKETINICRKCAVEVLPSLIADAVWLPPRKPGLHSGAAGVANNQLYEIEKVFWRAIACRVDSEAATQSSCTTCNCN